ncbi:MAG TPA: ATP-dependent Clp protease proteolytic subunit [Anaerovoracaceae bacterium]|nr:ATP-dependent Clp protease proteolytic subunit [Anaerovoracaceae bacterium]
MDETIEKDQGLEEELEEESSECSDNFDIYNSLAQDRFLFLSGDIVGDVANKIVAWLLWLDKKSPTDEITIYINSDGGNITNGLMTVYDTFQFIHAPIRTICIGEAYSSAAVLLAAGSKGRRFAYPNSEVMIHTVQVSDISGNQSQLEDESKRTKKLNASLMEIIARHSGQSLSKVKRDCLKDKYMTAQEALEYGLIDEIIKPNKEVPALKKR